jgi:hypothetical protein
MAQNIATQVPPLLDRLCSLAAAAEEQDPIGSGSPLTRLLVAEIPTPWTDSLYTSDAAGTIPQRMRALQVDAFKEIRANGQAEKVFQTGYPAFYGIAPDPEWSRPELRRVLLGLRSEGPIAGFEMAEYLFPVDSTDVVEMMRAYYEAPEHLHVFDKYRSDFEPKREFFVCTHGHVDICCARFGVPLYQQARKSSEVRAWRTTHFGGHRFAPTAWEFPNGYKWAFLDNDATSHVLHQDVDPAELSLKVRGWSGVHVRAQIVDREGLSRFGWSWLDYRREAQIVSDGGAAGPWEVRLDYESPAGERGAFDALVGVGRTLPQLGCGPKWGEGHGELNEYRIESLTHTTGG